jgi:hypothetical protein
MPDPSQPVRWVERQRNPSSEMPPPRRWVSLHSTHLTGFGPIQTVRELVFDHFLLETTWTR